MFGFIMSTVLLPSAVLMVPQYFLYSQFGLVGNLSSQWIGAFWGGGALNIFLVIQFMRGIPKDMDNAARIDGANEYQIFFRIVFPLCFNVFLYMAIGMAMGLWMDFQGPLLYLGENESQFTIALAFYFNYVKNTGESSNMQNQLMAMCVVVSLVPLLLFLCFQKQMIGGIKIGGLKDKKEGNHEAETMDQRGCGLRLCALERRRLRPRRRNAENSRPGRRVFRSLDGGRGKGIRFGRDVYAGNQ